MNAQLRTLWQSRAPRERVIIAVLALMLAALLYAWLLQSAGQARVQLRSNLMTLRAQAQRFEQQASEVEHLRAAPPASISQTDLRILVEAQIVASGLSQVLTRIDAADSNHVVVVFGAVTFADWLNWLSELKSQQVRLDTCRIEALSTPGLVSVNATLVRTHLL